MVAFRPFTPGDLAALRPHAEQLHSLPALDGEQLFAAGPAWTATDGDALLACAGFGEIAPTHAIAWAIMAGGIGHRMTAILRYARCQVLATRYRRMEAIVHGDFAAGIRFAYAIGLDYAHTLKAWGATGEDHVLFERIAA